MNLEELLNRRTDLSTFLVHFTRSTPGGDSAIKNLETILEDCKIEARSPFGAAAAASIPTGAPTQQAVCFSETPLEHAWTLCGEIPGRSVRLEPYGLAITKAHGRRRGLNPVWYTDITRGHDWLMKSVNKLVKEAAQAQQGDVLHHVLRLSPFIEQMGNPSGRRKEFWWE